MTVQEINITVDPHALSEYLESTFAQGCTATALTAVTNDPDFPAILDHDGATCPLHENPPVILVVKWPGTYDEPWTVGPFPDDEAAFKFLERHRADVESLGGHFYDPEMPFTQESFADRIRDMLEDQQDQLPVRKGDSNE